MNDLRCKKLTCFIVPGPLVTDMEATVESLNWRFRQYRDGHGF